jgi:hypothetical protein
MNTLFFLALLLICPAMMMLRMRGMRGGRQTSNVAAPTNLGQDDRRIADLEREVASLRAQRSHPEQVIDSAVRYSWVFAPPSVTPFQLDEIARAVRGASRGRRRQWSARPAS